jgi:hypothetical protein
MSNNLRSRLVESFIEVTFPEPQTFLRVKETLTRVGKALDGTDEDGKRVLLQLCHILHKKGRYYIVHHKEMSALDGHQPDITPTDIMQRNLIAHLLCEWKLVTAVTPFDGLICSGLDSVKVIKYNDRHNWRLIPQYTIGVKHKVARL